MIIRNKFNGYSGDGRRLYPGGGGQQQQPTNTTQTTTTIPEYARPTVERMVGRAEAFSKTPYQPYGEQRIAEFKPLQQKAFQAAENLGPAEQIGQGTQFAGISGIQGLGAGQRYAQQATSPGAMGAYMSPFTNLALEPQMREAARRSAMEGQMNQAQAAQRGAFGGSRSALIEAERQRNLGQLQSDIYGKGMQTAFEQARQAQQFGADLGLRGAGLGLQTAGQLGALGQQQFGQEEAAMRAKSAAGAQQQALDQQKLTQAYQDFLGQRGYEQQQLSFLSDILRGVPLSQTSYQMYQAPPSFASQAAQLGAGAYGFSQLGKGGFFGAKDGGVVKGYAGGGIAMAAGGTPYDMSIDKLRADLKGMSDEQLQTIGGNTDNAITLGVVGAEMDRRQAMEDSMILARSAPEGTVQEAMMGIDEAPLDPRMFADTAVGEVEPAPRQEPQAEEMARGGIVAFAKGNKVEAKPDYVSQYAALDPSKAFATPEARLQASEEGVRRYKEFMGADEVETATKDLMKGLEITPEQRALQRAGLAFAIASKFGRPGKVFSEEAGEASGVVAEKAAEVEKLDREIKRQQKLMNLDLKKTQRAEKRGQWDMMEKYGEKADARAATLYGLEADKSKAMAETQLKREQMANQLEQARISAGPGYASAAKKDFSTQILERETSKGLSDWMAKNPGMKPSAADMANINQEAGTRAANLVKQYSGELNRDKLQVAAAEKAAKQAAQELDNNSQLARGLRKRDKEKGLEPGTSQQQWLRMREKEILTGDGGATGGAGGAGAAGGAGGRPSLEEFLAKARPANPNASDADLISYYNRTYAQ
jgi:hypothetical protein